MATDFKYAAQTDLEMYYPNFSSYDTKRQVYGWTSIGNSRYLANDTGLITQLFQDGKELNKAGGSIASSYKTTITDTLSVGSAGPNHNTITYNAGAFTIGNEDTLKVGDYIKINKTSVSGVYEYCFIEAVNTGANQITVRRGALGTIALTWLAAGDDLFLEDYIGSAEAGFQWFYDSYFDHVLLYSDSDPNDLLIEAGIDNATYFDQMLVNASMELNNLLDARYPMPLPKYDVYDANTSHSTATTEYDAIIIKMTCYICISNLLRSESKMEEADYYHALVTNAERTGMVDRLNAGEFKLAFEVDSTDSQGKVRTISKTGSMDIVETAGEWGGEKYDVCRITCTTAGAYGTAIVKAETYGSDALFGTTTSDIKVTGGLQHIVNGLYVRFQGASMNLSGTADSWEVTVTNENRKRSNPMTSGIELTRGARGI